MNFKYSFSTLILLPLLAHASLSLTVDDLLADKNRFRLDMDVSYYNHHKSSSTTQGFDVVDLGNGRTAYLPFIGESNTNTDSLITGLGLRYGVSDKLEMGIKTHAMYRNTRHQSGQNLTSTPDAYLQDINLSTQCQFTKNHPNLPDMIGFSDLSLYDNTQGLKTKVAYQHLWDLPPILSMIRLC